MVHILASVDHTYAWIHTFCMFNAYIMKMQTMMECDLIKFASKVCYFSILLFLRFAISHLEYARSIPISVLSTAAIIPVILAPTARPPPPPLPPQHHSHVVRSESSAPLISTGLRRITATPRLALVDIALCGQSVSLWCPLDPALSRSSPTVIPLLSARWLVGRSRFGYHSESARPVNFRPTIAPVSATLSLSSFCRGFYQRCMLLLVYRNRRNPERVYLCCDPNPVWRFLSLLRQPCKHSQRWSPRSPFKSSLTPRPDSRQRAASSHTAHHWALIYTVHCFQRQ